MILNTTAPLLSVVTSGVLYLLSFVLAPNNLILFFLLQHIKIPKTDCSSDAFHNFDFYLSNVGKDNPQGSFECIRQYVSR